MKLRDHLRRPATEFVLLTAPSGAWTASRLLEESPPWPQVVSGSRVAMRISDAGLGLHALARLDGLAEAILLLSPSLPEEQVARLLERASCDACLSEPPVQIPDGSRALELSEVRAGGLRVGAGADPGSARDPGKQETIWLLTTSGTTGEPKLVSHSLGSLTRTTRFDNPEGGEIRWGLLYDFTRFAGLQVLLQAVLSGSHLIAPPREAPLREKVATFAAERCTHLSATPTLWRQIMMTPGAEEMPLRQVTLGGEIADDRILRNLSEMFPRARVTHIYASTEAGVGFSVSDGRAGFPADYLAGTPFGVAMRIVDDRLQLASPNSVAGYAGSSKRFLTDDGWIDTGDIVERCGDRVYFLGRDSGLINVGGSKVFPEEIERVLMRHPQVSGARAFGRRSSILGTVVAAEVVLDPEPEDPLAVCRDLRAFARTHLRPEVAPAILEIVDQLVSTPSGKLERRSS